MKLVIYMKSGNRITVRGVKGYEVQNLGDEIRSITIQKSWWSRRSGLLIKTLALSQIEAICVA